MPDTVTCPECKGTGKITRTDEVKVLTPEGQPNTKMVTETVVCNFCGGSGKITR